jgi:bacterioferritin
MWEMVDNDIIAEQQAIDLYKEIMVVAAKEGDPTTRFIFEQIMEQEEEHHNFFTPLKQGQPKKTSKAK